ncbi:MAG: hypothetical protein JW994_03915 [Candidatus Omnitrophica bacterium]|nr:hypothetical protein [Candidatus Omnitrophota bacterium]
MAARQHKIFIKLEPRRGNIYDRLMRVLAVYLDTPSVYAVPKEITDKEGVAKTAADALDLDRDGVLDKIKRDNYFVWLRRKVDRDTADRVKGLGTEGIYLINEPKRFYPCGKLACHIIGLTGIDNTGLEGLELYYNKELMGEAGWRKSFRDAKQREIISLEDGYLPPRDGNGVVLTVDEVIQHIIEEESENIVKSFHPQAVSVVAQNPRTGEILGLAVYPGFDPNDTLTITADSARDRVITDSFEPGSVFKIVTASAALEEKVVDFDSEFFCENGSYTIKNRVLHDHTPHGNMKFSEIIEKSSNIGTVKVAAKVGKAKLYSYIKKFNFGSTLNVDLPGETSGILRDAAGWSWVDMTTIPMGQGIAVTPLQLVSCVSTIANEGVLMRPFIAKRFMNSEGIIIQENKPQIIRRVISADTAGKVKELLRGVVERGTGKPAALKNYIVCGKTGTAQKVSPQGGYYDNRYVSSFIGFAPYNNPEIALAVCVDDPKGLHFGSQVAAPAFRNIMEKILLYMEVKGDKNEAKKTS